MKCEMVKPIHKFENMTGEGGDKGNPISHIPSLFTPNIPYPFFVYPHTPISHFFTPNIPYSNLCVTPLSKGHYLISPQSLFYCFWTTFVTSRYIIGTYTSHSGSGELESSPWYCEVVGLTLPLLISKTLHIFTRRTWMACFRVMWQGHGDNNNQ